MCSSQNPSITDERTTTKIGTVNYESNLPWKLTTGCNATSGDTIVLFIQGHMDFSSELCNAHKHISKQQQKEYVTVDINIFHNY
jgi:(p)ppGpp synthase/HD superfamily hydrolase